MRIGALLFDVDGTLADTEELHRQAFNAAFDEAGLPWRWGEDAYGALLAIAGGKERLRHFIARVATGGRDRAELDALVPALHAAKTRHFVDALCTGSLPLRPGVACLIAESLAHRVPVALVTTTSRVNVATLLESHFGKGWEAMFATTVCGEDVGRKKPSPEAHRLALSRLRVDASRAVALEDSANGLKAAKGAGILTVVTPTRWTAAQDFHDADLLLRDLASPPARSGGAPWLTLGDLEVCLAAARTTYEEVRA